MPRFARAELHEDAQLVSWASVIEHFAFNRSGHTTGMMRPQLQALLAANAVEQCTWLGRQHVALTSSGRRRLTRARRRGEDLSLLESPQHREWRRKHAQAIESIETDRERVRAKRWLKPSSCSTTRARTRRRGQRRPRGCT